MASACCGAPVEAAGLLRDGRHELYPACSGCGAAVKFESSPGECSNRDGTPAAVGQGSSNLPMGRVATTPSRSLAAVRVPVEFEHAELLPRWVHAVQVQNVTPYPLTARVVVRSGRKDGTRTELRVTVDIAAEPVAMRLSRLALALHSELTSLPPELAERLASLVGGLSDLAGEVRS
jgi:hypothetical protein